MHVLPSEARNFLVQIKTEREEELFAYVFGWTEEYIEWLNPQKHKRERIKHDDFATLFTGYVMLFEALDNAGEKDYKSAHRKELQQHFIENALILFVPALAILSLSLIFRKTALSFGKGISMHCSYWQVVQSAVCCFFTTTTKKTPCCPISVVGMRKPIVLLFYIQKGLNFGEYRGVSSEVPIF